MYLIWQIIQGVPNFLKSHLKRMKMCYQWSQPKNTLKIGILAILLQSWLRLAVLYKWLKSYLKQSKMLWWRKRKRKKRSHNQNLGQMLQSSSLLEFVLTLRILKAADTAQSIEMKSLGLMHLSMTLLLKTTMFKVDVADKITAKLSSWPQIKKN